MIFSKFLKNIWQIPLPEHLAVQGYAFPSGHMQGAAVFYGWIMLQCRNRAVTFICTVIMLGVAFGLLYFGYHELRDIIGGLGFAALTIALYYYLLTRFFAHNEERSGLLLAAMGLALIYQLPDITFLWLPEGALVGFSIGWIIAKRAPVVSPSAIIVFITYAFVGLWIAVAPWLISLVKAHGNDIA